MSGVAIAWYLLKTNSALTNVVPAARIYSGVIPLNATLPAIGLTQISGVQHNNVGMNSALYLVADRVQVSVLSKTYPLQKSILELVRDALPNTHGTVNGFACDSIIPDTEGPDLFDSELAIYEQSQDFFVRFAR